MAERPSLEARLRAKALACVAQREHSRVELRRKLLVYLACRQRGGVAKAQADARSASQPDEGETAADAPAQAARVDAVLDWLAERDLINTERFVETRVQARLGRFGHLRIRQELTRHGVELDATADQRLRDTELARARAVWARRFEAPSDAKARARQMRFLLARGFSAEVATQVLRRVGSEEPDEP